MPRLTPAALTDLTPAAGAPNSAEGCAIKMTAIRHIGIATNTELQSHQASSLVSKALPIKVTHAEEPVDSAFKCWV